MKMRLKLILIFILVTVSLNFIGCATVPKETIELSEITEEQVAELQKSHIRFIQLYYVKLRNDVNEFIDKKWMPLFLSKVVQNKEFRKDLDESYVTINIKPSDVQVIWKGQPLQEPQKSAVLSGIKKAVSDEKSRFAKVLLDFSEEAQRQINKKRQELLKSINEQEHMIINEINAAYADLYSAQAAIKALLASAVEVKQKQDLILKKLGVLEKSQKIVNTVLDANETLSEILKKKGDAEEAVRTFLEEMKEAKNRIKSRISSSKPVP